MLSFRLLAALCLGAVGSLMHACGPVPAAAGFIEPENCSATFPVPFGVARKGLQLECRQLRQFLALPLMLYASFATWHDVLWASLVCCFCRCREIGVWIVAVIFVMSMLQGFPHVNATFNPGGEMLSRRICRQ